MKSILTFALFASLISTAAAADRPPVTAKEVLRSSEAWDGKPIGFPSGRSEVIGLSIEIQPGGETGWHQHPVPSFAFVVEGTLQVTLRDGRTRRFEAGEAFAEVVGIAHNGRNVGAVPTKLLVLYATTPGGAVTIKD
jgi:quercetin dioxygenase-like cupin family protein